VFIEKGVPGVQLFSGPHQDYHRPTDTIDKIDAPGLVKVASLAKEVLLYLSERKEPLTFSGSNSKHPVKRAGKHPGGKRAGTGNVPDFSYSGEGVKISDVLPESPAQMAGIQKGDIIVSIDGRKVKSLKDYSIELKSRKPGDSVTMVVKRGEDTINITLTLSER
jgi:aminopeptidase N